jgi:carbon-monoxide dehydrogenase medium subunit
MALGAYVTLRSLSSERVVPLADFYTGVRQTVMHPDEMLVDIAFPAMTEQQRGFFLKLGLRRAQAISVVNVSAVITFDDLSAPNPKISAAKLTLGAVAPTIIHASEAESFLVGRTLDEHTLNGAAELAVDACTPIDDLRGSVKYRREMVRVLTVRGLKSIVENDEALRLPDRPVLLWGRDYTGAAHSLLEATNHDQDSAIMTRINGQDFTFLGGQEGTLLDLLRDEAGLIGTKEGCAEGECGACTVFLDGMAVMSCLVPAPRAHKAEITTIEGLKQNGNLHPVQEAFINEGAVQCGYCTPGFLMSAAMLLEEQEAPSRSEIKQAITGNLCRCTGYYKIISAIEAAVRQI